MQILELLTQRKFVSAMCDAHSNAHARIKILTEMNCSQQKKKKFATPTLRPTNRPQTSQNRKYERGCLESFKS